MQRAYGRGYARSIGVSNFGASDLDAVLEVAEVPPVINQVQFSPFAFRRALLEACERHGVALEAYSPLGTGRHLGDRRVAGIAERLGRTPAQVLIRWSLQRDLSCCRSPPTASASSKRAGLRPRALGGGHWGAGRARPHRRHHRALERPWW
jgi:diketogulonate reductase-like aldo/keto reductase